MIKVRLVRFSFGMLEIIHARCTSPHMILRKIDANACVFDIPIEFGILPYF